MDSLARSGCGVLAATSLAALIGGAPSGVVFAHAVAPQRPAAKARPTLLTWNKVPVCLEASVGQGDRNQGDNALEWKSSQRTVPTATGVVTLRFREDEAAVVLNDQPIAIGADAQGKPVILGDYSVGVRGFPDCDAPDYIFIVPAGQDRVVGRRWFLDGRRPAAAGEPAAVEFPGHYGSDTVVSLRDGMLTVSGGAADGDETTYQYHGSPVRAFVHKGAQPKYVAVIGKPNDEFYGNAAANETTLKTAGQETFDLLRARTSAGKTKLFHGRYLIVEGSEPGDFQRHGAVVIDTVKDAAFFIVCDDATAYTGTLVASSRTRAATLERGGEDVLSAFRFAGLTLAFDESANLVCDGECHDER
jgi:hypothetical protein